VAPYFLRGWLKTTPQRLTVLDTGLPVRPEKIEVKAPTTVEIP
jgi:hypothetical protein